MAVEVNFLGRLGNNLFQYALGRIIAEHLGLELRCRRVARPRVEYPGAATDGGSAANLESVSGYFPNAPMSLPGDSVDLPVESLEIDSRPGWTGHLIDLDSLLNNTERRCIRLNGYFQRFEYFLPYRQKLREWFRLVPAGRRFTVDDNDVVLNFRRGFDYGIRGWTLDLSYYDQVISGMSGIGHIYATGDLIDDDLRRHFDRHNVRFFSGAPVEQLSFIAQFKRIVMANSTFSWWAGFLSQADELYAPRAAHRYCYGFSGYRDVDLDMRDTRYIPMDTSVAEFAPFRSCPDGSGSAHRRKDGLRLPLALDQGRRALAAWLLQKERSLTQAEIRAHYGYGDLNECIADLLAAGVLKLDPKYRDAH